MTRFVRWTAACLATTAALALMARASAQPILRLGTGMSRLRLSWSARPERIEVCRELSANELAEREEHMRQRVECDGRFATYALRVEVDDRTLHEGVVRGGGLRHDRSLFVLEDVDVSPGFHRVRVSFVRREAGRSDTAAVADAHAPDADTGLFAGRARREIVERSRRERAAIPPRLEIDTTARFDANRVFVVTLDAERVLSLLAERPH